MKKFLSFLFLFVFALVLSAPPEAHAVAAAEQTKQLTASGNLTAGTLRDCGAYAGAATAMTVAITTSTKNVAYIHLPAATMLPQRLNFRDWNVSSAGMDNGGVVCGSTSATLCVVTVTGGGLGKEVDCHYRP
jgi:hypothetical protein